MLVRDFVHALDAIFGRNDEHLAAMQLDPRNLSTGRLHRLHDALNIVPAKITRTRRHIVQLPPSLRVRSRDAGRSKTTAAPCPPPTRRAVDFASQFAASVPILHKAVIGALLKNPMAKCPLLGIKRTSIAPSPMSAFDPKRTLRRKGT